MSPAPPFRKALFTADLIGGARGVVIELGAL
jgi:hypothetical protein